MWQDGSNTSLSAAQILDRIRPHGGGDAENLQRLLRLLTRYDIFLEHLSAAVTKGNTPSLMLEKTLVDDEQGLSYAYYMLQRHQVNSFYF